MRDLLRTWRRIEALPISAGVDEEWTAWLGDDLPVIKPYLRTEQQPAASYPCPSPAHENCPRRVIEHGPDDIVAVCGNVPRRCEPLNLTRQQLVVRSLKTKEWIAAIAKELRAANGLTELDIETPTGVIAVGALARRGRRLGVVWVREPNGDVENMVRGLRSTLEGRDLIVVLPPGLRGMTDRPVAGGGIVLLTAPKGDDGRLDLYRALDLLDPGYRQNRVSDPLAIFDDVRFEFAEEPGVRHVVRINGLEYGGFQKSDLKFLRLLLLAARRREAPDVDDGGWLEKFKLQGDDKDHDLEDVRDELRRLDHALVPHDDRGALVKRAPGRGGKVRLAVPPTNISFDPSLAGFIFIGELQSKAKTGKSRPTPGQKARAENFAQRDKVAKKLLDEARKHGVPAPAKSTGRGE
jgi:hypothetical protein